MPTFSTSRMVTASTPATPGTWSRTSCRCAARSARRRLRPRPRSGTTPSPDRRSPRPGGARPTPKLRLRTEETPLIATVDRRPLVNLELIRWHLTASAVFFTLSLLGGLAYSFQFNQMYPFAGIEWLSPGRVRMVHTNMAAYGFIANAFIAGMLFAIPRLTRRPILSDRLGWLIFGAWQLILVLTIVGQLAGYGHAIEWGET